MISERYKKDVEKCGTQARKGKGGPRVEEKSNEMRFFLGVPGGIPIPFFAVAGTRNFGINCIFLQNNIILLHL